MFELNATLVLDESMQLPNASSSSSSSASASVGDSGGSWSVQELYPRNYTVGTWGRAHAVDVTVAAGSARVLSFANQPSASSGSASSQLPNHGGEALVAVIGSPGTARLTAVAAATATAPAPAPATASASASASASAAGDKSLPAQRTPKRLRQQQQRQQQQQQQQRQRQSSQLQLTLQGVEGVPGATAVFSVVGIPVGKSVLPSRGRGRGRVDGDGDGDEIVGEEAMSQEAAAAMPTTTTTTTTTSSVHVNGVACQGTLATTTTTTGTTAATAAVVAAAATTTTFHSDDAPAGAVHVVFSGSPSDAVTKLMPLGTPPLPTNRGGVYTVNFSVPLGVKTQLDARAKVG